MDLVPFKFPNPLLFSHLADNRPMISPFGGKPTNQQSPSMMAPNQPSAASLPNIDSLQFLAWLLTTMKEPPLVLLDTLIYCLATILAATQPRFKTDVFVDSWATISCSSSAVSGPATLDGNVSTSKPYALYFLLIFRQFTPPLQPASYNSL